MNEKAVSQVISAVLLVAVAIVASTAFYAWFTGLQSKTQEGIGETTTKTALRKVGEIGISTVPEYYSPKEKFVQEIAIKLENRWVSDLSGVFLRVLDVNALNESVEWVVFHAKDYWILNKIGNQIDTITCSNSVGIPYYTKDGLICGSDYDFESNKQEIHNPTYYVGYLRKDETKEVILSIYVNTTAPNDLLVRIYVGSDQGLEGIKTLLLRIR
ncbi:MAG: archaellin/type IV pilin N-terminal domain-containing protein [Candidatus Jordarchaeaceae archaeon]